MRREPICRGLVAAALPILLLVFVHSAAGKTHGEPEAQERAALRETLDQLTQEIDGLRSSIRETRTKERSLAQEVDRFDKEIRRTELSLLRSGHAIAEMRAATADIERALADHEAKRNEMRGVVAAVLRDVARRDDTSALELLFSGESFSAAADALAANDRLQAELLAGIEELQVLERGLEEKRGALAERRAAEEEARLVLLLERDELRVKRELRETILQETEGREQEFAARLRANEANAARIRSELYLLEDLGKAIPFGEAYAIARRYADSVGIRPAFLLAVLQKESRLGALVGSGNWRTDMHPRDWPAFMDITRELGLDPDTVPVSRKPSYGWGGAMGPAQFLPSTWLSYRDRIAAMTGNKPPSPWNIDDAFAAAAVKLSAAGAAAKTADAEWRAAMIYFAGGNWRNPAYAFYGDAVEDLAAFFEEQIAIMKHEGET